MPLTPVNPTAQTLVAAQQQELLYRELLSRAPYANDPALTQQVNTVTSVKDKTDIRLYHLIQL